MTNYDGISAEIAANTLRLGFTEPRHDHPTEELNGVELTFAYMFRSLIVPYAACLEALRKPDEPDAFTKAIDALQTLARNATYHAHEIAQVADQPTAALRMKIKSVQDRDVVIDSKLALVPTELVEAHLKRDLTDLGDAIIRIQSIAGAMQFSLDEAITREMANNATRQPKHGKEA